MLGRWIVALCWALCRGRLMWRVGMTLLVVHYARSRMMDRMMIWRRQALRRMRVMLEDSRVSNDARKHKMERKKRVEGRECNEVEKERGSSE